MRLVSIFMTFLGLISFFSCSSMNHWVGLDDDNFFEESAEDILKKNVGLDLDFTPNSKEVKE